jgi:hypothetical protein
VRLGVSTRPRVGAAALVEVAGVILLVTVLLIQLLSYPTTEDPDPDGYVSYANQLLATGTLAPSRRLPGYPIFLAVVARTVPGPLNEAVYWVQLWLTVLVCLGAWAWTRWRFGALPALCLLGIVAAPSYFSRMAVLMLSDVPYSMLMLPLLLGIGWWTLAAAPRGGWLWLLPFALLTFVLQATRATTLGIVVPFAGLLVVGLLVARRLGQASRLAGPRTALARAAALIAVALLVGVACDRYLDTGAREFNADMLRYRAAVMLPPADNSAAERRIEDAKRRYRRVEGQRIEDARFSAYDSFDLHVEIRADDVRAVWQARLLAHPGQYLASVLDEFRLGHYIVARQFVPYFLDVPRYVRVWAHYPRNDGSPEGDLFRRSGLVVLDRPGAPPHNGLEVDQTSAIVQLAVVWGLIGLGLWRLWRRDAALIVAFVGTFVIFNVAVAATNTIDARFLLPFAIPIYLLEAIGVAWIAQTLVRAAARPV